jgi:hypothetical protein
MRYSSNTRVIRLEAPQREGEYGAFHGNAD